MAEPAGDAFLTVRASRQPRVAPAGLPGGSGNHPAQWPALSGGANDGIKRKIFIAFDSSTRGPNPGGVAQVSVTVGGAAGLGDVGGLCHLCHSSEGSSWGQSIVVTGAAASPGAGGGGSQVGRGCWLWGCPRAEASPPLCPSGAGLTHRTSRPPSPPQPPELSGSDPGLRTGPFS